MAPQCSANAINKRKRGGSTGQALLITVVLILFAMLILVGIGTTFALKRAASSELDVQSKRSYFLAEAGLEDAVFRLKRGKNLPPTYTLSLSDASATISVTPVLGGQDILSVADVRFLKRAARSFMKPGVGISFPYGVQIGEGGLVMENTSKVIGSVYSNGNIIGNNSPTVTGDAFAATISRIGHITIDGLARAHLITDTTVGESATSTSDIDSVSIGRHGYADRIIDSTIGGDAYYQSTISGSTVGGSTFPATPAPSDLPEIPMPIADSQLDTWETEAEAGGVISSPCPYEPASGSSLGPVKINCDLVIDGTKIITLAGTLWVSGNFSIENSAQLKLSPSFGSLSGVVIADTISNRTTSSKISVENSAQILGSGTPGSYVLVVSRNNSAEGGGSEVAIDIKNSSNAPVFYAPHGLITIQNNTNLKEATAYKLHLKNSATVTYESGLVSANFSSGPGGGWSIDSWKEVVP